MCRKRLAHLLGVASIVGIVVAACAPAATPIPTAAPAVPATASPAVPATAVPATAAPTKPVTLVYVTPSLALAFDSCFMSGRQTAEINHNVYGFWTKYPTVKDASGIMRDDPTGGEPGMKGGAWESWEISPDGKVYTMHLRKNLVDNYGNQVKAEDIKWFYDRLRQAGGSCGFVLDVMNITKNDQIKVIDDYTVQFTLSGPSPVFLRVMNVNDMEPIGIATARQHATSADPWAIEWLKRNPPATGPYMLETWTPGVEQVLVRNPNYYGPKPQIERVDYRVVPDSSTRVAMLLSGEAQIARDLSMDELERLRKEPNVQVLCYAGNQMLYAPMNTQTGPTSNVKVREALAYAVPYNDILSSVYRGLAKPMYGFVADIFPDFLGKDAFPYKTDYTKAKQLLSEGGYPNGLDLTILISNDIPEHERTAVLLKNSFSKIGVNLSIDLKPAAAYRDLGMKRQFQITMDENYPILMDVNYAANLSFSPCEAPCMNWTGLKDDIFDGLLAKANTMPSGPERTAVVKQEQQRFYELTPWLALANTPTCRAMSKRVQGWTWHTHNQTNFEELSLTGQ